MFLPEFNDPTYFKDVKPATGSREFIKPGYHKVTVTAGELVANKDSFGKDKDINTHASFVITFTGVDGDAKGIDIKTRFNLRNPNETAVNISKSQMLTLFDEALQTGAPKNSVNELFNKPIWIKVTNGQPAANGRIYSEVNMFYPISFVPPYIGTEPGYTAPVAPVAAPKPVQVTPVSTPATAAAYGDDSDIPF